jgi:hypothetical protein
MGELHVIGIKDAIGVMCMTIAVPPNILHKPVKIFPSLGLE